MGVASGWNLWVWLECIGVVSGCCLRRYNIDILIILLIPTPLVLAFFQQHPYFFVHFKMIFHSLYQSYRILG